jgi:voltage-gated potassium channel
MRDDAEFRAVAGAVRLVLAGGTVFYWQVEGWRALDALYFCVMTIAAIGCGDLSPSTNLSKAFAIVYAILGVGLFAGFVGKIVALAMKRRVGLGSRGHDSPEEGPRTSPGR